MIKDLLKNAKSYYSISKNVEIGLKWLESQDFSKLSPGRYNIIDEYFYANVDEYDTKDDASYEAHRKYIDIQFMVSGEEKIGITDISNCKTCVEYDEDKDIEFFDAENDFQKFLSNEFFILFPHDAHKPCINLNAKAHCKKIVVKVPI